VIFDKRDSVSQRAFERALAHHRAQSKYRDPHFQLNVTVDVIDVTDNFQLASASKYKSIGLALGRMSRGCLALGRMAW
ncbi:glutamate receptor 1, partial [Biomphalaria glabrata]